MKHILSWAGALIVGMSVTLLSGCGPKGPTLHLYTWQDYLDPELISEFEKANQCRIKVDTFDSNEAMYAKLQAGSGGYDIIFPSSYQVKLMADQKMIVKLDKSKLPNVAKNFDKTYNNVLLDPEMTYNVPYAVTFTGLAYRKDKVGDVKMDSWKVLDNEAFKNRISLLNDMRETIGAALKANGFSVNTTDEKELKVACDTVLRWKKNIAKFDNEQYKTGVAGGEFVIGHGYNGDVAQVQQDDPENIGFFLPSEGFIACCDEMVIPTSAQQPELAYKFIDFMYDGDNACRNIQYICTVMPNREGIAKLPEEFKKNPCIIPDADGLKKAEVTRDLGEKNALYIKVWDLIKGTE